MAPLKVIRKFLPKGILLTFSGSILVLAFSILSPSPAFSSVTVGPTGDYLTIEAGLIAATLESDKLCLVQAGTYTGPNNGYDIDWPNIDGVTLRGAGTNTTIISADALGRVINVGSAVHLTIESITLMNGATTENGGCILLADASNLYLKNARFLNNQAANGGAFFTEYSPNITAEYCVFSNNSASASGGMTYGSSWTVIGCTFEGNNAVANGGVCSSGNGGLWQATDSFFIDNTASVYGGVLYDAGTGTVRWDTNNCVFTSNEANNGGIIYSSVAKESMRDIFYATNCKFYNNRAVGTDNWGGVVMKIKLKTINCIFSNNSASYGGVAEECNWVATNCVFALNNASTGGGVADYMVSFIADNCIFWGNTGVTGEVFSDSSPTLIYSDLQPDGWFVGNPYSIGGTVTSIECISSDPLFINAAENNFHLLNTSECVDTGTFEGAPTFDADGVSRPLPSYDPFANFDIGAYERSAAEVPHITVIAPNGGETLLNGHTYEVTWKIEGTVTTDVYVRLSTNEGTSWDVLITRETGKTGLSTFELRPTTSMISDVCLISVEAGGPDGWRSDSSNATFAIVPDVPNITVITPNGGETLRVGATYTYEVTWKIEGSVTTDVYVRLSTNEGTTWDFLVTHEAGKTGTSTYEWMPSNDQKSLKCLISVEAGGPDGWRNDKSDSTFQIVALRVTNNNTGTRYYTIQDALNEVDTGEVITAEAGIYPEHNLIWPNKNNVTLRGAGSNETIISAEALGRGIYIYSAGYITIESLTIRDGLFANEGAGIYNPFSSVLFLKNVNLIGNASVLYTGGAVHADGRIYANGCTFKNNSANSGGATAQGEWFVTGCNFIGNSTLTGGSAGVAWLSYWTAENCTFRDNRSADRAGVFDHVYITMKNCVVDGNSSYYQGGVAYYSIITAESCLFIGNSAGIDQSGGVLDDGYLQATNCIFLTNSATYGGVVYNGSSTVTNCVFAYNDATYGGVACVGSMKAFNSIFWGNTAPTGEVFDYMSPSLYYSDLQSDGWVVGESGTITSQNCISSDPLFRSIDVASPNFMRLGAGSPCIDRGPLEGSFHGFSSDMGIYEFQGPSISLESPNGGEILTGGSTWNITWEVSGEVSSVINARLSTNKGATWNTLITSENAAPGKRTIRWNVTPVNSINCLVSIDATGNGIWNYATSAATFEIITPIGGIWVSKTGGDANDGSFANPVQTIARGLSLVSSNDTVNVYGGTYNEYNLPWPNKNNVTLKKAPGETIPVTIDAQSVLGRRIITLEAVAANVTNMTIEGITLQRARSNADGGGIRLYKTNTNLWLKNVIIQNCSVEGGTLYGGAVQCIDSTVKIFAHNCVFYNNKASWAGGVTRDGTWTMTNCIFSNNWAQYGGVANEGKFYATNCIFYKNFASSQSGIGHAIGLTLTATNCVFWANGSAGSPALLYGTGATRYCDLQNNGWSEFSTKTMCTSLEPMFISTFEGAQDFRLKPGSPCIDAGTNETGVPTIDAYDNPRPHGLAVDQGIYELQGPSVIILSPNGGEFFSGGTNINITWKTSDEGGLRTSPKPVTIRYSINGGSSWALVTSEIADTGIYTWEAPQVTTKNGLISIEVVNLFGAWNCDTSNATFEIVSPIVWVSTTGFDDTGDGTQLNPYRTIANGLAQVAAGQKVYAMGGNYNEWNIRWPNKNNVTLKAYPDNAPVTIDAESVLGRRCITIDAVSLVNNLTIEGITLQRGRIINANGAGIYINKPSTNLWIKNVTIQNCSIEGTDATNNGAGIFSPGDNTCKFFAQNCKFNNNRSGYVGGAFSNGVWTMTNCIFSNNSAIFGGVSNPTVNNTGHIINAINCTFNNNYASNSGGVFRWLITLNATNCVFSANSSPTGPLINNPSGGFLRYCDVQSNGWNDLSSKTACISLEPVFVSTPEGNFHLRPGSPCIDAGTKETGIPTTDADGYPRPHGFGVDQGAYEFRGPSITVLSPNGGETLYSDGSNIITWKTSDEVGLSTSPKPITIKYSTSGGSSWALITKEVDDTGIYTWESPQVIARNGLISIEAVNFYGIWNYDASNATFEIVPTAIWVSTGGTDDNAPGRGTVSDPFRTISFAFSQASAGNKVYVYAGTYNEYNIRWPNKNNVTLKAYPDNAPVTIDAGSIIGQRCITLEAIPNANVVNMTIEGITLQKGRISGANGGGIYLNKGSVRVWLINDTIQYCSAEGTGNGGAVYVPNNSATIEAQNCVFRNNIAYGGGVGYNGTWTTTNCVMSYNRATGTGGGGVSAYCDWFATGCTIEGNWALSYAGVGYYSNWTATNCAFTANRANNLYGGISNSDGSNRWNVTNCVFSGNSAGAGGIDWNDIWFATNCIFTNNTGNLGGGFDNSTLTATNCSFMYNYVNYNAAYSPVATSSNVKAKGCSFIGNYSLFDPSYGGVATGGTWNTIDCTFEGNYSIHGGGVFNGVTVNATNCAFNNNRSRNDGVAWSGTVFANGCTFTTNQSTNDGGVAGGNWTAINCKFTGNKAGNPANTGNAGVSAGGIWNVRNCTFEGNSVNNPNGSGGVANGSTFNSVDCLFVTNTSSGGASVFNGGTVNATNCVFVTNRAFGGSGGVINSATVNLLSCSFTSNEVRDNGGAAYGISGSISLCAFSNNSAYTGGVIYFGSNTLRIRDSSFTNNRATLEGGVFFNYSTTNLTTTNCAFSDNRSNYRGGVMLNQSDLRWYALGCSFTNNIATADGGVIHNRTHTNTSALTMEACTFTGNKANNGAVVFNDFWSDPNPLTNWNFKYCTFTTNQATQDGGVCQLYNNDALTVIGCTFEGNSAGRYGGVDRFGKWNVRDSTFRNNIASDNFTIGSGGVIFDTGVSTHTWVVTNCAFTGNKAFNTGGVADTAYMKLFNCTFTSNEALGSITPKGGVGRASTIEATNCIFKNNKAGYGGVAESGTWTVTNCAIYKNTANTNGSVAGGQTAGTGGTWNAVNTIFWANGGTLFYNTPAGGTLKYCDIQDNLWGNLTPTRPISAEPRFVSTAEGAEDFHLKSSSPCIDSGTLEGAAKDKDNYDRPLPVGGKKDIGPYEYGGGIVPAPPVIRIANKTTNYYSLNAALNDATAGDTIILPAGTYSDVSINWPAVNNITLSGEGTGKTTIEGIGTGSIVSIGGVNATIEGITFKGGGGTQPGAISVEGGSITVNNCEFIDLGASSVGSTLVIRNCLWRDCSGSGNGGAVHGDSDSVISVINSTLYGNSSSGTGGALYIDAGGILNITNSILWNNSPNQIDGGGTKNVNCSDIQGGWPSGTGNISSEPRFVATLESNFRLQSSSPCIDMATAVGAPAKDLDGISRPQPAPPTYSGGIPDMGAYEYHTGTPIIDQQTGKAYYNLAVAFSSITQPTVISLPAGDYSDVVIVWPDIDGITLEGQGSQETVLTGVDTGPIIYVGDVTATIQNIGFVGGGTQQSTIIFDGTTGLVENCKFVNIRTEIGSFITYRNDLLVDCGMMTKGSDATIWAVNSTFYNTGISIDAGSAMKVVNCILWNSSPTVPISGEGTVTVEYSDVQGGWTGTGNINVDPFFVNTTVVPDGFQLQPTSECIDSGTSEGAPLYDFNSVPRPQPPGGKFDIGCFEWTEFPKITVEVNGERFLSGDLLAPSKVNTVRINATSGVPVAIVEMFIDGVPVTGITGSAPWWSGTFTSPASGGHHLMFLASNEASRISIVTMEARVSGGAVKMIGNPLNYPNPFKPMSGQSTRIQYTLTADAPVTLIIYDITGHEVKRFNFSSGENGGRANINSVFWDGKSLFGQYSGNAMYIYKVIHKDRVLGTGKLVILD